MKKPIATVVGDIIRPRSDESIFSRAQKVTTIKDPAVLFSESVQYVTHRVNSIHWANLSDIEIVQLMTLRRAIATKLIERMGGV